MGSQTSIMIIDDSYTNRILLKAILEELDIQIIDVNNATSALEILDENNPDIILLDMCMPIMDGLEFLKELQGKNKKIPVIVISVLDDQAYIRQAYQSGASEYLLKPVDITQLLNTIVKYTEYQKVA